MIVDDFFDGYPKLAAFMESDANFMEFRQYKYLRIRRLLHMQAELKEMEDQLSHLDAQDAEHDEINLKSRDRDDKQKWPRRKELLEDIHCKLDQYGKAQASFSVTVVDRIFQMTCSSGLITS